MCFIIQIKAFARVLDTVCKSLFGNVCTVISVHKVKDELQVQPCWLPEGSRLFDQEESHSIALAVLQATLAPPGTVNIAGFCHNINGKIHMIGLFFMTVM